jgi:hypothetical protein
VNFLKNIEVSDFVSMTADDDCNKTWNKKIIERYDHEQEKNNKNKNHYEEIQHTLKISASLQ